MEKTITISIITWMTLGLINLTVLYYIYKKETQRIYKYFETPGQQAIMLTIWFVFAFIIIPTYLLRYLKKYIQYKIKMGRNKTL